MKVENSVLYIEIHFFNETKWRRNDESLKLFKILCLKWAVILKFNKKVNFAASN